MTIDRILPNLLTDALGASRDFYVELLGLEVAYDSDWFVQLTAPEAPGAGLGLLQRDHALVPAAFRAAPQGVMLTFVVRDTEQVHRRALGMDAEVIESPHDTDYGQRRLLLRDPDGVLVDISAPTAPPPATPAPAERRTP